MMSTLVASASFDGVVRVWQVPPDGLHQVHKISDCLELRAHLGGIRGLAFSPDGHFLASCDDGGNVFIWSTSTTDDGDAEVKTPIGKIDGLVGTQAIAWFLCGGKIAVSGNEGCVYIFAFPFRGEDFVCKFGDNLLVLSEGASSDFVVQGIAVSQDGRHVASGSWAKRVLVHDAITGALLAQLPHTDDVWRVAFFADGNLVSVGDRFIKLWNPVLGKELHVLDGHFDLVPAVATARRGGGGNNEKSCRRQSPLSFVSGGSDSTRLYCAESGKMLKEWKGISGGGIAAVAMSEDGELIAAANDYDSDDEEKACDIDVLDAESGVQVAVLKGAADTVWALAFGTRE